MDLHCAEPTEMAIRLNDPEAYHVDEDAYRCINWKRKVTAQVLRLY